ncbi:hypothetical protein SPRG_05760 [Saprolegnia parasitica CBS 223.65]|uniref:ARID domain-containing protein n=1 Tax=Saprolegnia parasitica (strain CBS 223.65) TaxID=695850 RepID=A0A067CDQ3_SAPPC|nr:hypothetical protein SPRG_05760 [Saprolegnia parasitica CBS 223.65]KDO28889.1 hypothetical protein SPRG_05760 [Saprolegnia parasitica CBS 223.65]|eukprot:XP_012200433.1 hypothetical protein SPRG_05760 [Saprolegnia parasitica CBS 223.65]
MQGTPQKQWVELQLLCRGHAGKNRILQSLLTFYTKALPALQQQPLPVVPDATLSIPRLLDIVQLYEEVVARGGASRVSEQNLWSTVATSMKLKMTAPALQQLYATWLGSFELQQVHGKAVHRPTQLETIATHPEIQATTSIRYTPLPMVTKRLKTHRQQLTDLGLLHRLVLALDSTLPDHIAWALNQLTVLSYGHASDTDCDIHFAHAPGLLDALCRQLPPPPTSPSLPASVRLFAATDPRDATQQHEHGLRVLNIVRNLSMVRENEAPLAAHATLRTWLFGTLKNASDDDETAAYAMDILVQVARAVTMRADEWDVVLRPLTASAPRRSVVLQSLDILANCLGDAARVAGVVAHARFPLALPCIVALLSRRRQDGHLDEDDDDTAGLYDDDDDDDDMDDGMDDGHDTALQEDLGYDVGLLPYLASSSRDLDASLSPTRAGDRVGANMGMVFVSRQAGATPDGKKADFQIRDLALQVLYYVASANDAMRLWIARQPDAMERLGALVASGRAETARLAVGLLSQLSLHAGTWPYLMALEPLLLRVATSDASLSDLVVNVMADVYGMNALP